MLASPAWAHGADAPDGTDYRTAVTAVSPARPGLTVRAVEAGARLELTNHAGTTVEVLGYYGEPYLSVRPDGVYENVHSPAVYLNATLTGTADAARPRPTRRCRRRGAQASSVPVARWHDHRVALDARRPPPPSVAAGPTGPQRVRDWAVPLRVDGAPPMEVRGTLDWVPPPVSPVPVVGRRGRWLALAVGRARPACPAAVRCRVVCSRR